MTAGFRSSMITKGENKDQLLKATRSPTFIIHTCAEVYTLNDFHYSEFLRDGQGQAQAW